MIQRRAFHKRHQKAAAVLVFATTTLLYGAGMSELSRKSLFTGLMMIAAAGIVACVYALVYRRPWQGLSYPLFETLFSLMVAAVLLIAAACFVSNILVGIAAFVIAAFLAGVWWFYRWSQIGTSRHASLTIPEKLWRGSYKPGLHNAITTHPRAAFWVAAAALVALILLMPQLEWPWAFVLGILTIPFFPVGPVLWNERLRIIPNLSMVARANSIWYLIAVELLLFLGSLLCALIAFWFQFGHIIAALAVVLALAIQAVIESIAFDDPMDQAGAQPCLVSYALWIAAALLLLAMRLLYMWIAAGTWGALLLPAIALFPMLLLLPSYMRGFSIGRNVWLLIRQPLKNSWRLLPIVAVLAIGFAHCLWVVRPALEVAFGVPVHYPEIHIATYNWSVPDLTASEENNTVKSTSSPKTMATPATTATPQTLKFSSSQVCGQSSCTAQQAQAFVDGILARISKDKGQGNEARGYTGSPKQESARLGILLFVSGVSHPDMEQLVRFAPDSDPQTATVGYEGAVALDRWLRGKGIVPLKSSFTIASFAIKGLWTSSLWVYDPEAKVITVVQQ